MIEQAEEKHNLERDMSDKSDIGRRLQEEVLAPMRRTFVGKDEVIDLLGLSLVAGENLFILGPPGTAKSALVQDLGTRLHGRTFEYLLTRFTEPNELFGPFDIRKLREGVLETNTEGMLPEASIAFLDELLNANSAILNSLLSVLNERVFRRGREAVKLPLLMSVGASNHLPEDEALRALFDRFLLRVRSDNVSGDQLGAVLTQGWEREGRQARSELSQSSEAGLSIEEIRTLNRSLPEVNLSPIQEDYLNLVDRLRKAGLPLSDRRAVKLQRPVAASALLCGRSSACVSDLWVFRHVWDLEEQEEVLCGIVDEVIGRKDETTPVDQTHPQAEINSAPDPEALGRDLDAISSSLEGDSGEAARAVARDKLAALRERLQWVQNPTAREHLNDRVTQLWPMVDESE